MNYMKEIAAMLGVELGEEFRIRSKSPYGLNAVASLTDSGFRLIISNIYVDMPHWEDFIFHDLLKGIFIIEHKQIKPAYRDCYWSIKPNGEVHASSWLNEWIDLYHYKIGNCYCTKEEAEANRDKWITFYNSDEVLEGVVLY